MFANRFIKNFKPYKLSTHKAWQLSADTEALKLDWNEAAISPSPLVINRLNAFINSGRLNWYPDVNNTDLLNKISDYCGVHASQVQYFGSSDYLHEYLVRTFLEDNDRVVMVSPTYDNFRSSAESLGAIVDFFYLDKNFLLDIEQLKAYLDVHKPKIVYICNPNNPTGTEVSESKIKDMLSNFPEILFIIDEAYYEFSGITCAHLVHDYSNLIVTRTFSKAFALASFRIGYAISCEHNISEVSKIRNAKNISQCAQIAAIAALDDIDYTRSYVEEVNIAKGEFKSSIESLKDERLYPVVGGGNFMLLKIDQSLKAGFISYLEGHKVFVRNYEHVVSMEDYVRISVGTCKQMQRVFDLIRIYFI